MGWLIFFITSIIVLFVTVPIKSIVRIWPIGLVSIFVLYLIDGTLANLGAFRYSFGNYLVSDVPILYLLSSFSGGIILTHYYPKKNSKKLPYIMLAALVFLSLEFLMYKLNYFHHMNWSMFSSFLLNCFGFIVTLWLAEWFKFTKI